MFLFCWYFDFLCKFKIFNELCYIDKISFSLFFACFLSCVIKEWIVKLANASQFMQNMAVNSLIENIKTKIVIKFHFINSMTYLARVAYSMVIFSASYDLCFYTFQLMFANGPTNGRMDGQTLLCHSVNEGEIWFSVRINYFRQLLLLLLPVLSFLHFWSL